MTSCVFVCIVSKIFHDPLDNRIQDGRLTETEFRFDALAAEFFDESCMILQ